MISSGESEDYGLTEADNCTFLLKAVSDYTNTPLKECENYYLYDLLLYYRSAIIEKLLQSEEGRNILKDFKRLNMEEDSDGVEALREMFGDRLG